MATAYNMGITTNGWGKGQVTGKNSEIRNAPRNMTIIWASTFAELGDGQGMRSRRPGASRWAIQRDGQGCAIGLGWPGEGAGQASSGASCVPIKAEMQWLKEGADAALATSLRSGGSEGAGERLVCSGGARRAPVEGEQDDQLGTGCNILSAPSKAKAQRKLIEIGEGVQLAVQAAGGMREGLRHVGTRGVASGGLRARGDLERWVLLQGTTGRGVGIALLWRARCLSFLFGTMRQQRYGHGKVGATASGGGARSAARRRRWRHMCWRLADADWCWLGAEMLSVQCGPSGSNGGAEGGDFYPQATGRVKGGRIVLHGGGARRQARSAGEGEAVREVLVEGVRS